MDTSFLQQQRFLLQKKVKRLNSCDYKLFHSLFVQFWHYLKAHPIYSGVLGKLATESRPYTEDIQAVSGGESVFLTETEKEAIEFTFRLLEHCAAQPLGKGTGPEVLIGRGISHSS